MSMRTRLISDMPVNGLRMRAVGLAAVMLLSACTTVGPDFKRPQVPAWLAEWTGRLARVARPRSATPRSGQMQQWWRNFNDPVLDHLIAEAQRVNPNVRTAGLRIMEARAQLGHRRQHALPAGAAGYRRCAAASAKQGQAAATASAVTFNAGLRIGWELDFWGKFRRSIEAADAGYFASIAQYDDVQVLMAAQVAAFYSSIRTLEARLRDRSRKRRAPEAQPGDHGAAVQEAATIPNWMCSRRRPSISARWPPSLSWRARCARHRTH